MRNIFIAVSLLFTLIGCNSPAPNTNSNSAVANKTAPANTASSTKPAGNPLAVNIGSPDGVKLVGSFFEAAESNSPALLLLHQWQSDRHSYDDFAKRMNVKGFNVLAIDGRGFGESTKKADGTTVSAERTDDAVKAMLGDVGSAFDFLSKQRNVDPNHIGIIGASYGSSLALIYAADNPKVAAVALLSPGLNYFGNMATEPAIRNMGDHPVLLVAAEDDPDSASTVKRLKDIGAKDNFELKIYPKGGHGTGLFRANVGLEDLLEQFLVRTLSPRALL